MLSTDFVALARARQIRAALAYRRAVREPFDEYTPKWQNHAAMIALDAQIVTAMAMGESKIADVLADEMERWVALMVDRPDLVPMYRDL